MNISIIIIEYKMYYYNFDEFTTDINHFSEQLKTYKPDVILAIARGGVTFGHFLAEKLNLRELYTLNSIHYNDTIKLDGINIYNIPKIPDNTQVLVVDDIVDSGDTMLAVLTKLRHLNPKCVFKTGAIFYKTDALYQPDFKLHLADDWIHFFWNQ